MPRKSRSTSKSTSAANTNKVASSTGEASNVRHDYVAMEGRGMAAVELSTGFNTPLMSQPLAPIGTPAVKSDSQAIRYLFS